MASPLTAGGNSDGKASLSLKLLGGFSVERNGLAVPESAWQQRRSAKSLLKLLALTPNHTLHREQILDELWSEDEMPTALKKFTKALHVARHAVEPELPSRGTSSYLRLQGDVLTLESTELHIDVSDFRALSERALRSGVIADCEAALLAYRGDLLPEDRYEDWAFEHRQMLSDLVMEVYLTVAEAYEHQGAFAEAVQRLRHAERMDPVREEVHRHLMRLYARMGKQHQALRQYQVCRELLASELDVEPSPETELLHSEIVAGRFPAVQPAPPLKAPQQEQSPLIPLIGRDRVLQVLMEKFYQAKGGHGGTVFISGEIGVGKSRVVNEMIQRTRDQGAVVMRGSGFSMDSTRGRYESFAQAIDAYVSGLPLSQRQEIANQYVELAWLVPSLAVAYTHAGSRDLPAPGPAHLFAATARFLTDVSHSHPVVLVLRDLHCADPSTVKLLEYLSHVAAERRWLLLETYREEDIPSDSILPSFLLSAAREGLSTTIELHRLARQDCDELVRLSLPDGRVEQPLSEYIYEMSLGNPLFAQQLVNTLVDQGHVSLDQGMWSMQSGLAKLVPREIRNLVAVRIAQFDDEVQRVLQLAASAGPNVTFGQLRDGAQAFGEPISEAALLRALDRALEARLLEEYDHGYTFCHPLFRAALYEHLSRHRREQLRAALDTTKTSRDQQGAIVPEPDNRDETSEGVDSGQTLLPWEAAGKYGRQVDMLDSQGLRTESAAARQKLAAALIAMGRYERAMHVLRQADDLYTTMNDADGRARVAAQMELLSFASPQ